MKIGLALSFQKGTLDGKYYIDLFEKFVRFKPYSFRNGYVSKPWDEKKHLNKIAKAKTSDDISVIDKTYDLFSFGETGTNHPFLSITIEQEKEFFLPSDEEIFKAIDIPGFVSCYLYHQEYCEIQSASYSNTIEHKNFSPELWATLKDTPCWPADFGGMEYDIKYNPGRISLMSYTWLMASWKMWFGEPFFDIIPREKIMSFKEAYCMKELRKGIVFVQLFEKVEESLSIENMLVQQNWRDWLMYDEILHKYS